MRKRVFMWLPMVLLTVAGVCVVSCGDDNESLLVPPTVQQEGAKEDAETPSVSPDYVPVDWSETEVYESNPEGGTFSFESTDETRDIEPGAVLAIDEGDTGYLVRVTGVEKSGDRVTVTTETADLCDIFSNCEITLSSGETEAITRYAGKGRVYTPSQVFVDGEEIGGGLLTRASASANPITRNIWKWGENYDNTVLYSASNAKVYLEEANFNAALDVVINMSFGDRDRIIATANAYRQYRSKTLWLNAMVRGTLESNYMAKAVAEGSKTIGGDDELWKQDVFLPITMKFMVGEIPVFVQLRADLFRGASLEFAGDIQCYYGARGRVEGDLGFEWQQSGGISPVREMQMSSELIYPTVEGKGRIDGKTWLYPRMYVMLYGLLGPSFDIKPYLGCSLTGGFKEQLLSSSNDYCAWQLKTYTGIDVSAGLDLKLWGLVDRHEDIGTLNVAEKDLYRSPKSIAFHSSERDKVQRGVKNKVSFKVFDENLLVNTEVVTPLPQIVKFEAPGTLSSKYGIASSGIVSVEWTPASNNDKLTAVLYDVSGNVISKVEWGEAGDELTTCPDENHPHAIDLGLPSGTKWACCNVGATTPEGYGGYYAWGETSEKSSYNSDTYRYYNSSSGFVNIGSDIAGTQYDVAHVKWGGSWRMPSYAQQTELREKCSRQWTQQNGVNGILVTGSNGGQIFLPAAGYRWGSELSNRGAGGDYWSSSLYPGYSYSAYGLGFNSGIWDWYGSGYRYYGRSVRAVCP